MVPTMEHSRFVLKTVEKLGLGGEREEAFLGLLARGQSKEQAIVWMAERPIPYPFPAKAPATYQPTFVDRIEGGASVGASSFHEEGAFYSLDLSSVFELAPLMAAELPAAPRILDVCASPGGKSIIASRLLSPSLLVGNEVIRKRTAALISNLSRCKISNAVVVSHDVAHLKNIMAHSFDVVLVDAPCSGQSLIARGLKNPGCFHPSTIRHNESRQRRIVATASGLVKAGGYLLYSTCTYSPEENEDVISWLISEIPSLRPVEVKELDKYRSTLSDAPAYRLYPMSGEGAGGFTCLMRAEGEQIHRAQLDLSGLRVHWSSHEDYSITPYHHDLRQDDRKRGKIRNRRKR